MMPWQLLADPGHYINGWLIGYAGALGSVAGVLIVDYWIIRRTVSSTYVRSTSPTACIVTATAGTWRR